jgi:hypothetical protein
MVLNRMEWCGLNSTCTEQRTVTGCCEDDNELSDSINSWDFLSSSWAIINFPRRIYFNGVNYFNIMLTVPIVCFLGHVVSFLFDKIAFIWTFLFVFLQESD